MYFLLEYFALNELITNDLLGFCLDQTGSSHNFMFVSLMLVHLLEPEVTIFHQEGRALRYRLVQASMVSMPHPLVFSSRLIKYYNSPKL